MSEIVTLMTDTRWIVDKAKSHIRFKVKHLMIANVQGEFMDFQLDFNTDGGDIKTAEMDLVIKSNSLNTNSIKRDKHLKSTDFLDVENYPTIAFKSTYVEALGNDKFRIEGDLTIRDEIKSITFDAVQSKSVIDRNGVMKNSFNIQVDINRKDFGLNWSKSIVAEEWPLVGDIVHVTGNIELIRQDSTREHRAPFKQATRSMTTEKHFIYTAYEDDLDGCFMWHGNTGQAKHWIFGNCTGDTRETYLRSIKIKQLIEMIMREYPDVESPCQFLRILHDFAEHDPFLAYSYNEHNSFSMDAAYVMIKPEEKTLTWSSARMYLRLLGANGGKYLPMNNISLGYPLYNIGKLVDHSTKYMSGDQLVIFNEELPMQHGGAKSKRLGLKGAAAISQDNSNFEWERREAHLNDVLKKWRGENQLEDITLLQIQL